MQTKKILIIEDEQAVRESIIDLLEAEGLNAVGAENGQLGVQLAQQYLPDLILCDVQMPEVDGYSVLASLRQTPSTATIPFIFLTARSAKNDLRQGMNLGADDYLTKPCTAAELLNAVSSRLQKQVALQHQSQKQLEDLRHSIALSLPHELRTPLNGILGLSNVLLQDYDTLNQNEILELAEGIHESAERLYRLVQNFLLYAELEIVARSPERPHPVQTLPIHQPCNLISRVAMQVAMQAGRIADLQLQLQEDIAIAMNEVKLQKILEELIDNAFKFSAKPSPVMISSQITPQGYELSIRDWGRGMNAEQVTALGAYMQFERKFYEQQGSGLGFVIARRLTELYGGKVLVDSSPNQGTTVRLVLPINDN